MTDLLTNADTEQISIPLVDYKSAAEKRRLEILISQEMSDLFVSPECTDDPNILHNKNKFKEINLFNIDRPIVAGFMLTGISELLGYEFLKINECGNLKLSEQDVVFGLPTLPDENAYFGILSFEEHSLAYLLHGPSVRNKKKVSRKIRKQTFTYSSELEHGKFEGNIRNLNERALNEENLSNYFKSLAYEEDGFIPHTFLAASTISRTLWQLKDEVNSRAGLYTDLNIKYFRAAEDYELGYNLITIIEPLNEQFKVSTMNEDNEILVQAKTTIKFIN